MKYDFNTLVCRKDKGSAKWNGMSEYNNNLENIVPFSVADMEFKNAPEIIEHVCNYLKDNIWGYTTPTDEYYDAVISWEKRRHHWDIQKEWIYYYPGVVDALHMLVKSLSEENDNIVTFTPVYYPFFTAIENNNRNMVKVPLILDNDHYVVDYELFEEVAKTKHPKLIILCSPHNPIGKVYTKEELIKISNICLKYHIIMICDEIHHDLIMNGYNHTVLATISEEVKNNCVICTAPSKTFNLAGMITSNIIIPSSKIRAKVDEYQSKFFTMCNIAGYQACIAAYQKAENWLDELLQVLDTNRQLVEDFMKDNIPEIKVFKLEGTYLQWWDCRDLNLDYQELEIFMKDEAKLFLDEGYMFGEEGKGFERINIACPTNILQEGLDRLLVAYKNRKF